MTEVAQGLPPELDQEADRLNDVALDLLNKMLKDENCPAELGGPVLMQIGANCVISAVEAEPAPAAVLLSGIKALIETAIAKGWLPRKPANATMVLVLSDDGVRLGQQGASTVVH